MPSLTLRRSLKDAQGKPLEADALYTPINPFATGHVVYNPGIAELRGNHPAVVAAPHLWVRADASSEEKDSNAARATNPATSSPNRPHPRCAT